MVFPKLKLAKFLDHGVVCEDLASNPVPTAMCNSRYQFLLGIRHLGVWSENVWKTFMMKGLF